MRYLGTIWMIFAAIIAAVIAVVFVLAGMTPILERLILVETLLLYVGFVGTMVVVSR